MKKVLLFGIVIVFLFSMIGCSGMLGEKNENGNENVENDDWTQVANNNEGSTSSKSWPSNINEIPEFTYGDISKVDDMSETHNGVEYISYSIFFKNIEVGAGEKYCDDLLKAGFRESQPPNTYKMVMKDTTVTEYGHDKIAFETPDYNYNIQADHWVDDANEGAVLISIPVKSDNIEQASDSSDEEDNDEDSDEDSEYNWDTLDGKKIPDGYPNENVPIVGVDNGVILGTDKQEMGAMGTSYVIIFGVNEEMVNVAKEIKEKTEKHMLDNGGSFQAIMDQMFMGNINNCQYTIAVGDGTNDGYTTTVDYTVIVSN